MDLESKIYELESFLKDKKSVLAFSGGSDSTLLAFILSKVSPDSLLVTIDNNMMSKEFIDFCKKQAEIFNLKHEIIELDFLKDETFINNSYDRCYECRKLMYENIMKIPDFNGYDYFIEGTNITDLLEDRPGILVRNLINITSPLIECNITKDEVYEMIEYFNLEYSNDTTCLATRIKTDQKVDCEKLNLVYNAEKLIKSKIDQKNIRVRIDNSTAIITVDKPSELLDEDLMTDIRNKLQKMGFKKVFLDLTGYEKTKLEYSVDEKGNYYYKLPYEIDLEKTSKKLKNSESKAFKSEDTLIYDDIIIEKNGKISMLPTEDFVNKFNSVLYYIERKNFK